MPHQNDQTDKQSRHLCTVLGAGGRMGRLLVADVVESEDFALGAAVVRAGSSLAGEPLTGIKMHYSDDPISAISRSALVIDVSVADQVSQHAFWAAQAGAPYLVGITDLSEETFEKLDIAARHIPVLYAANFSLAVNVLANVLARVSKVFDGIAYDCDILDTHHRHKVDAPSGTAMTLAQAIQKGRAQKTRANEEKDTITYQLRQGVRKKNEIHFAVRRQGGITGEHEVTFANDMEMISFGHRSLSRRLYTQDALRAARWLMKQVPGLYYAHDWVQDLIGESD